MGRDVQSVYVMLNVSMWKTVNVNFKICGEGLGLQLFLWSLLEKICVLYFSDAFIYFFFFFSKVCSQLNSISTVQVIFCSFQAHSFAPLLTAFVCQKMENLEALKF